MFDPFSRFLDTLPNDWQVKRLLRKEVDNAKDHASNPSTDRTGINRGCSTNTTPRLSPDRVDVMGSDLRHSPIND